MFAAPRKLELFFLSALPTFITLCLVLFSLSSGYKPHFLSYFSPLLYLMPIFYWGMARAREMPYWFVFCIGLINDSVSGQPLGLSSLLYLLFLLALRRQRKYFHKDGFLVQWGYFAFFLGGVCLLNSLVLALFFGHAKGWEAVSMQWVITVCCYPLLHAFFYRIHEFTTSRRWYLLQGN